MIKIDKPETAPEKLTNQGAIETEKLKQLYEADAQAYQFGTKQFTFDKKIYGHKTVKQALKAAQHDKCCFCERKTEVGDVEHYRGKGGYQQDETEALQFPGYYWLAYVWKNLFFCCETCNRSYKRSFFPLENPTKRALSHADDHALELPLIINPSTDNPEDFIEFYGYFPKAINGNRKGAETIKRTGLDRPFIDDRRRDHYTTLKFVFEAANKTNVPDEAREELMVLFDEAAKSDSEYASMVRCAIKHGFRY